MKCKQIKKIGVEGFSKTFHPNIFYLLKKGKKCLKKAENFWCNFSGQHFGKKTKQKKCFLFGLVINLTI